MSNKVIAIKPLGFPWETQDPFLFCAYHRDDFPAGDELMGVHKKELSGRNIGQDFTVKNGWRMYHGQRMPGFPYHPHRGFETITINKEGVVDHTDSLGAAGRFMGGDVQWMTAGKGIQHSEMFPLVHSDKPNPLEMFQVWLNLPKVSKFVEPHFKMLWKEQIPVALTTDAEGRTTKVEVIAGRLGETLAPAPTPDSWAADKNNAVGVFTIEMDSEAEFTLPAIDPQANRSLYFYKGSSLTLEGEKMEEGRLAYLKAGENITIKNGGSTAFLLVLEGKPIKEPVAQYGPFVMNTQEEIRQAMRDYQVTQFGGWPWAETEVSHPKGQGRFAKHADGREEVVSEK